MGNGTSDVREELPEADLNVCKERQGTTAQLAEDVRAANQRGVELLRQNKNAEALKQFEVALAGDPQNVQLLSNMGLAAARMQDYNTAYDWYEKAFRVDPGDAETLFSLAWVERKRQRFPRARELFQKVLEVQPDHAKALYLLGDLMKGAHEYEGAIRHLERLVRSDPGHIEAHITLAQCHEGLKQYARSAQILSQVLQQVPGRNDVVFSLGRAFFNAKQYHQAIMQLDRIPDADIRGFEARTLAAKACRELEDHTRAINNAERAAGMKQQKEHAEVMRFLYEEYMKIGDQGKAAVWFGRAAELEGQHQAASPFEIGQLMYRQTRASPSPSYGRPAGPDFVTSGSRGGYLDTALDPASQAAAASGTSPEDLERLLWRAEHASAVPSRGGGTTSAEVQWTEVLLAAKASLRRRPDDVLGLKSAARALLATGGDATEIRECARRAQELGDEVKDFTLGYDLHAYLGGVLERERSHSAAERHFSAALSCKPGDEMAMLGLGRAMVNRKENAKARQLFEQVARLNPTNAESHIKLAELSLEAGDFTEAYRLATKGAQLAPMDAAAFLCLGQSCIKTSRNEEATRAFEQALAFSPNDAAAMHTLANLHRRAGRDQEAMSWFKKLLDLRPGDYDCNLSLAQMLAVKGPGGASQAVHYFRGALQCRPSSKEARSIYLQMATVQCSISSWKDAQQTLEGAVREISEDAEIWRKLLFVYEQLQDAKNQHLCFRRLGQLNGLTNSARISYCDLLAAEGQRDEARQQLREVLKVSPESVSALLKLAGSFQKDAASTPTLQEALKGYERVLELAPGNPEALEGAAYCHRKLNNQEQAILLYQQCLKVQNSAVSALYYLGDILYKQHRHAECQHYLTRLLEATAASDYRSGALYLLAKSHVSMDEYEEAEKHARAGLAIKPNHPHFLFILGLVQNRLADYDTSLTTLRKALQFCEQSNDVLRVDVHDWLAQAYERKKDYEQAVAELDKAQKIDPQHAPSFITRGQVYLQLKQFDQAEASLRRALAIEANHAMALVRLGYCKLLENNLTEAVRHFQLALQQRCGTVILPRSVKGCARIYLAIAAKEQQDVDGALLHLAEARKTHRNFNSVCTAGREAILKGSESLKNRLKTISDLDLTEQQAWVLVQLLAKEIEIAGGGSVAPGARWQPSALAPTIDPRLPSAMAVGASSVTPAVTERRQWAAPPAPTRAPGYSATASSEAPRQWVQPCKAAPASNPPAPEVRRQWTPPPAPEPAKATPSSAPSRPGGLKLELHEQIDMSKIIQHECLGSGGFGAVYRGFFNGREVAIKKLFCEDGGNISPLQLEELEKEVLALRSLDHPRLVAFIGACLQPPNLCIVTEFMAGGSLHHLLHKAKTPLTISQQAKMALQVSEGVAFLHSRIPPVVHRDLKSLNIVLDKALNAKICDFGLTQSMDKTHISLKEGGNGGSPRYMAPECYDSKGKITEKVDVWALGCILVEVFGGPLPYDDCNNIQQIVAKVLIEKSLPYIPHHLPPGVRPIVVECFNFDIKLRASAPDVYSRLRQLNLVPEGTA